MSSNKPNSSQPETGKSIVIRVSIPFSGSLLLGTGRVAAILLGLLILHPLTPGQVAAAAGITHPVVERVAVTHSPGSSVQAAPADTPGSASASLADLLVLLSALSATGRSTRRGEKN